MAQNPGRNYQEPENDSVINNVNPRGLVSLGAVRTTNFSLGNVVRKNGQPRFSTTCVVCTVVVVSNIILQQEGRNVSERVQGCCFLTKLDQQPTVFIGWQVCGICCHPRSARRQTLEGGGQD